MNLQKVNHSFEPGYPHGIIFPSHSTGTVYEQYPLRRAPSESPSLQEESCDVETVSQGNQSQELTENTSDTSGDEPTAKSSESLNADHGETTSATQPFSESSSDQFLPENQAMAAAANANATEDQLQEDDTRFCAEKASALELSPYIELPSSTHGIQIAPAVRNIPTSDGYVY